jgi:endothelin-converting enzyme/putative endopeptidase
VRPSRPLAALVVALVLAACRTAPPRPSGGEVTLPPLDETALDRSVSPCDDFYQFACGGWLAATEIPADRSEWSRGFAELEERNMAELRRILEGAAAGRVDPRDRFAGKVGDFFASCMDEQTVEARGLAELRAEWAGIDAIGDRPTLVAALARLNGAGIAAPLVMFADQDAKDATVVVLQLVQAGLSLPDRDYYLTDTSNHAQIRTAFAGHLRRMLALAGLPTAEVEANATAVEGFERSLAETHWTRVELRDPALTHNRVDRAGLEKLAPAFPWGSFLETLGHPELTAVSVTTPRFIERTGQLFESAPLETWKAYLRWRLLAAMADARALPRAFVEERFRFESAAFSGATELRPRWKHCVSATDDAIGFALGQIYVRLHFGAEGKDRTSRLVGETERAMGADLDGRPWMDEPTRARAREKLAKVVNKIGYPDVWRDYSSMRVGRDSFFRNVLSAGRFETSRQLAKLGKPVDRTEWFLTPATVNAYYNPTMNEMAFPAGILQPPFFNRTAPEAVNYGAIGMVVGHELTHGFDDEGRKYDALGNLRDWWSPDVARAFDTRAQCLVDQFGAYEPLPGVHLDGKLTLGENIADLGGLKLALAAAEAARRGRSDAGEKLLGFTPEQQFFVGFAQSWCSKEREEHTRLHVATDPHAPPRFRVNGVLSNLPAFAAAFSCKDGRPMVRPSATRCEIW